MERTTIVLEPAPTQWFRVTAWLPKGGRIEVEYEATDPEAALARFLRRRTILRELMSEQPIRFTVEDMR